MVTGRGSAIAETVIVISVLLATTESRKKDGILDGQLR
jgi:hypothetical protein